MEENSHYSSKNIGSCNIVPCPDARRYDVAKDILTSLINNKIVNSEIKIILEVFPNLSEAEKIELFGKNISEDDVLNYTLCIKAINLADTFLEILDRK